MPNELGDAPVVVPDITVQPPALGVGTADLRAELAHLSKLAYLLCGDHARADDAAAEALARVWRRSQSIAIEQLRPYLRRTLVNLVASNGRRARSEYKALVLERGGDSTQRIDDAVVASTDVRRAMQALPSDQRVVIALRYFEDLSEAEIAKTLHLRPGTVKSRTSRGMAALKVSLEGSHRD